MGLLHDPLGSVPLTTVHPPPPIDTRLEIKPVARHRTAKEALLFEARAPAAAYHKETDRLAKAFLVETDATRRDVASREMGLREGQTADKLRAALAVHSDKLVAHSKQGVVLGKLPPSIAERSIKSTAKAAGRRGDAAWDRSAIKSSLNSQMAVSSALALKKSKEAMEVLRAKRDAGFAGDVEEEGEGAGGEEGGGKRE